MKNNINFFIRRKSGFSLIELMIAIFIFMVVFAGILKGLTTSKQVLNNSIEKTIVSQILGDVSEQIVYLKNTGGWHMIETSWLVSAFTSSTVADLSSLNGASVNVTVVPYKDKSNVDISTLKQVTINLTWTDPLGTLRSDSFVTVLSKPPEM